MIVHGISQWVIRSLATVSDPRQLAWDTCHEELAGYTLQRATTAERESSTADCDSSGRPCLWSNTYKCARLHWLRAHGGPSHSTGSPSGDAPSRSAARLRAFLIFFLIFFFASAFEALFLPGCASVLGQGAAHPRARDVDVRRRSVTGRLRRQGPSGYGAACPTAVRSAGHSHNSPTSTCSARGR